MRKPRLKEFQGYFKSNSSWQCPSSTCNIPQARQLPWGHAGLGAHLEGSSWQVGDGNILEVILQGVNERRNSKLERVHILHQDGLVQEENQVLHVTWVGGREAYIA